MALVKDEIFVIKGISFSEADRIVTVFGKRRGRFSLIAKGVRKIESKNRPSMQTLSHAAVTYYEGLNLGTLIETDLLFAPILDYIQVKEVSKVLLIMNKLLPEDESDPEIFKRVAKLMRGDLSRRDVNQFRLWMLDHLGYLPDMRRCGNCGTTEDLVFLDTQRLQIYCSSCGSLQGEHASEQKLHKVSESRYESDVMDSALDRAVREIFEA